MIWFDAGEIGEVPPRSDSELQIEEWEQKLGEWRARQERAARDRRAAVRRFYRMPHLGLAAAFM